MSLDCRCGFGFAVLCCGYTLTDFPISIRLTSLALWQSNDCPSASKATLVDMDKYFMWIHYERLHNHNKAKHNKTVCIFLGIYCMYVHNVVTRPSFLYPLPVIRLTIKPKNITGRFCMCLISALVCTCVTLARRCWVNDLRNIWYGERVLEMY